MASRAAVGPPLAARRRRRAAAALLALVALSHAWSHAHAVQLVTGTPSLFTAVHSQHHTVVALHGPGSKLAKPGRLTVAPGASARTMTDKDGKQFVCYLPPPGGQGEADGDGDDGNDLAAALATAQQQQQVPPAEVKTPFELLERMTALCLYRQEGLWTYEMCYKKQTRQFRQATGDTKGEDFSCGVYPGDEVQSEEIRTDSASPSDTRLRYVSQNMTGGAPCALTGASRTSEVRFMCVKDVRDNVILSVREFPTCNYIFTVSTTFLCKHPQFKPPEENLRVVHCVPAAQPHARHQPQQQLSHQADAGAAADEAAPASGDGGLAAEQAAQPAEPDQAAAEEEEAVVVEEADEDLGAGDSAATEVPQPEGGTGAELDEEEEVVVEEEGEEEAGPDASEAGEGAAGTGTDSEATAAEEGAGDSQAEQGDTDDPQQQRHDEL